MNQLDAYWARREADARERAAERDLEDGLNEARDRWMVENTGFLPRTRIRLLRRDPFVREPRLRVVP